MRGCPEDCEAGYDCEQGIDNQAEPVYHHGSKLTKYVQTFGLFSGNNPFEGNCPFFSF